MKYQKFGVHFFDLGWQLPRQILTKSKKFQKNKFLSPKQVLCRLLCNESKKKLDLSEKFSNKISLQLIPLFLVGILGETHIFLLNLTDL